MSFPINKPYTGILENGSYSNNNYYSNNVLTSPNTNNVGGMTASYQSISGPMRGGNVNPDDIIKGGKKRKSVKKSNRKKSGKRKMNGCGCGYKGGKKNKTKRYNKK